MSSSQQQHYFNCPHQLAITPENMTAGYEDRPEDAVVEYVLSLTMLYPLFGCCVYALLSCVCVYFFPLAPAFLARNDFSPF